MKKIKSIYISKKLKYLEVYEYCALAMKLQLQAPVLCKHMGQLPTSALKLVIDTQSRKLLRARRGVSGA